LVGFDKHRSEFEGLGLEVFAASVDPADKAGEVAAELYFRVGYGVTREQADRLGSWREERRQIIQPSAFVLAPGGEVLASCYSDGPIGRMDAADVFKFATFHASRS